MNGGVPWFTVLLLALMGCTARAQTQPTFRIRTDPPLTSVACSPVPAGVRLPFPTIVRSDEFYRVREGEPRRRVVLQYLDTSNGAVTVETDNAFVAAGFATTSASASPGASSVLTYTRPGDGPVTVIVQPLSDASADLPVQGALLLDLPATTFTDAQWGHCPPPDHAMLARRTRP